MLHKVKDLRGDKIAARDGEIGRVDQVYFDDQDWRVRYFVVDTGGWLPGREVLISPASVDPEGSGGEAIRVNLTRAQVEQAPEAEKDMPVSRQFEEIHARYYGYPYYWGPGVGAGAGYPLPQTGSDREVGAAKAQAAASHLRSGAEVLGYRIEARDGKIGHLEDLMVDDRTWGVDAMVVDTTDWLPGGEVRVPPQAVERIDWQTKTVHLGMTREQVKQAPKA